MVYITSRMRHVQQRIVGRVPYRFFDEMVYILFK